MTLEEHVQKILYKANYNGQRINLNESNSLVESKKTEEVASNILSKENISNVDNLVRDFLQIDKTKNQILLPAMAKAYAETKNLDQTKDIFSSASKLINSNKIKPIQQTKKGYMIGNEVYADFLKLSEYIHGLEGQEKEKNRLSRGAEEATAELVNTNNSIKPIFENDKFAIYDGNNINSCIQYGKGELTGKSYRFCIGDYGSNNMWQSYRDNQGASFYYILDKEKTTDDPFHIVVFMPLESGELMLTHEINSTLNAESFDNIYAKEEFGVGYVEHLKRNNVPVEKIMPNIKKTPEENLKTKILSRQNNDLDWFKNLGKLAQENGVYTDNSEAGATFKMMNDYIGRGYMLSDEQFGYLFNMRNQKAPYSLLNKYVTTGQALPESQFNKLIGKNDQE